MARGEDYKGYGKQEISRVRLIDKIGGDVNVVQVLQNTNTPAGNTYTNSLFTKAVITNITGSYQMPTMDNPSRAGWVRKVNGFGLPKCEFYGFTYTTNGTYNTITARTTGPAGSIVATLTFTYSNGIMVGITKM